MDTLFDGPNDEADSTREPRLARQIVRVYEALQGVNGAWIPLPILAHMASAPEASVSARMRDLRKPRFGAHTVYRKHLQDGLYAYCLVPGSGDGRLVYEPAAEPASAKLEARHRLTEYLAAHDRTSLPNTMHSLHGVVLRIDDIREMLR